MKTVSLSLYKHLTARLPARARQSPLSDPAYDDAVVRLQPVKQFTLSPPSFTFDLPFEVELIKLGRCRGHMRELNSADDKLRAMVKGHSCKEIHSSHVGFLLFRVSVWDYVPYLFVSTLMFSIDGQICCLLPLPSYLSANALLFGVPFVLRS